MSRISKCISAELRVLCCLAVFVVAHANDIRASQRIELVDFRIEPRSLKLGESFVIRARAVASEIEVRSFLLRTAGDVRREDLIPGLSLYSSGKYYVAENGNYFLKDNGKLDSDPRLLAFALTMDTSQWKGGTYTFAFFASCRPSKGPFVVARHDFAVVVKDQSVFVEDLGPSVGNRSRAIRAFKVQPAVVDPGETVVISVTRGSTPFQGLQLTNPYYVAAGETLPGFHYDATRKKSFYGKTSELLAATKMPPDRNDAGKVISLKLDTTGWPSGVHHLLLNATGFSGRPIDYRSFAIKVRDPRDQLDVTVESSQFFRPGTHFGSFIKLRDGTLLSHDRCSRDGGRTWQGSTSGFGVGGEQLGDGTVLGMAYRCLPQPDRPGWYSAQRFLSTDGGHHFAEDVARLFVPEAKAAMGHGPHVGPLFMRSIVQREDGSLVALMAGWFKGDTALCPYGRGRPYSRSYLCESNDRGLTWRYLTTIGYERIGSEGYNEGSMRRLPNGELLAVLRTGNERDFKCQDNPIMWSVSRDEGRMWSRPRRMGVEGAYPSLAVLSDGVLVMSYGRPGAMLIFSSDNGRTWTDQTLVDATTYSGYTGVVEIEPGLLLVGFGAQNYLDPTAGKRESQLRLVRVRYAKR